MKLSHADRKTLESARRYKRLRPFDRILTVLIGLCTIGISVQLIIGQYAQAMVPRLAAAFLFGYGIAHLSRVRREWSNSPTDLLLRFADESEQGAT